MRMLLSALVCGALTGLVVADEPKSTKPIENKTFDTKAPLDNEFLVYAAEWGNAQQVYANLVDSRSARQDVKDFAKKMSDAHKECCKKLGDTIKDRKLAIVAGTDKTFRETADSLKTLKDVEFDKAYLQTVVADHNKVVEVLENQIKNGKDVAVTDMAKETLKMMKEHLDSAKKLVK